MDHDSAGLEDGGDEGRDLQSGGEGPLIKVEPLERHGIPYLDDVERLAEERHEAHVSGMEDFPIGPSDRDKPVQEDGQITEMRLPTDVDFDMMESMSSEVRLCRHPFGKFVHLASD